MILPDVNLLIHAYNSESPVHAVAKSWWETQLNGEDTVGLAWAVILGFVRLVTHPAVSATPLPVDVACDYARSWLARPQVTIVHPGERHAAVVFRLLESLGTAGNLTTDAHLAALAIEYQAQVQSTDADFARFPGLRWSNPLRR